MTPEERSKKRLNYYQKLAFSFTPNEAYQIAEILVKPPEAKSKADMAYLRQRQQKINEALTTP
ncbi:MAG TPA: hypothetical protein DCE56_02325 [Cyanobacteria bacterium UBA8553]|nr:hypothetical protein [Cyanobacteria bacterium UBA8553]HAJ64281.1 hypothetical protein [Cyanobacteria bacterium UBA8543]